MSTAPAIAAPVNAERLLERFLRYVRVDTTAVENAGTYPSSPGQLELGRMIAGELRAMGLADVEHDAHGLVWATVPGNVAGASSPSRLRPQSAGAGSPSHDPPVVAFNAHLDTSPETTGRNVRPQVVRNYQGGDLVLPGDPSRVIRVADNPELQELHGRTLVTTDGTTLLGADDKAGVAVIVELAQYLLEHPEIPHGPVRILFTCDEEIGHGIDHVDLAKLGAQVCYTLDGHGAGEIDVETFSADLAVVTVTGVNIHPSIGKGRMVNAVRVAAAFVDRLPRDLSPERTDGRDGFVHPYVVSGGVAEMKLRLILRDFDTRRLSDQAALLRHVAVEVAAEFPGSRIDVAITPQYRNMAEGPGREPRAVPFAVEAHRRLGLPYRETIVRGGTDGSQLTARGLPTPNLSTGEHNPHSPLEWTCLEEMAQATQVLASLVAVWSE